MNTRKPCRCKLIGGMRCRYQTRSKNEVCKYCQEHFYSHKYVLLPRAKFSALTRFEKMMV